MNKSFLIVNYASLRGKRGVWGREAGERKRERLSFRTITRNVQPPAYTFMSSWCLHVIPLLCPVKNYCKIGLNINSHKHPWRQRREPENICCVAESSSIPTSAVLHAISLPSPLGFFLLCLQIFHLYVKNFARTTESYIELFCWMNIFGFRTSVSSKVIKGALWLRNCAKCDEYRVSFNQVGAKSCIEIFFRSVNPREKWEILLYIDNLDFTCDVTETLRICMSEHWISDWNLFRSPNKRVYTSSARRALSCHLQRETLVVHRLGAASAASTLVARLFIFSARLNVCQKRGIVIDYDLIRV